MTKNCTCGYEGFPKHNDFYDCVEYYEEKNGKTKGQWMIDWVKKSKKNETGSEYYYFDNYAVVLDPDFSSLKGKWVNILINAKWSKKGFLHFWIDGKLRTSYFGDTMVGASSARFKFGPYRHHMDEATDAGLKIPDTVIRYSNVGKADSCDDLWNGCSDIISQLSLSLIHI